MAVVQWEDKDPTDVDDFTLSFVRELGTETIATTAWTATAGITLGATGNTDTTATVRISGGTAGTDYTATCTVTTSGGRTLQRSSLLRVRQL
jgi:hypothetical protein